MPFLEVNFMLTASNMQISGAIGACARAISPLVWFWRYR